MQSTTVSEGAAGRGVADGGMGTGRTRRWRRVLAGYTANVTTYVAAHVIPGRRRAPVAASGATLPAPPIVVAPPAPPAVTPRVETAEGDARWPGHVVHAIARILIALDWATGGASARRRRR